MYLIGDNKTFTESELLWNRISNKRFLAILNNPETKIVKYDIDGNSYGEFLFITLELPTKSIYTFYALGYHEAKESYELNEAWKFYSSDLYGETPEYKPLAEFLEFLNKRIEEITLLAERYNEEPSERGQLFTTLVNEMGDEDGILNLMEDMGI